MRKKKRSHVGPVKMSMVYQFELVQFFAVKVRLPGRTGVSFQRDYA